MNNHQEKSWKDRVPPDGHMPGAYEVQVCDDGNKIIAIQMLDKAGVNYKISARDGQFFIQAPDMECFTNVKRVLNQTLDMNKEANKLGFWPATYDQVTPIGTNTPTADITPASVPAESVKEVHINESTAAQKKKMMEKSFKEAGCDEHQWEVWKMAWSAGYKDGYDDAEEEFNEPNR